MGREPMNGWVAQGFSWCCGQICSHLKSWPALTDTHLRWFTHLLVGSLNSSHAGLSTGCLSVLITWQLAWEVGYPRESRKEATMPAKSYSWRLPTDSSATFYPSEASPWEQLALTGKGIRPHLLKRGIKDLWTYFKTTTGNMVQKEISKGEESTYTEFTPAGIK